MLCVSVDLEMIDRETIAGLAPCNAVLVCGSQRPPRPTSRWDVLFHAFLGVGRLQIARQDETMYMYYQSRESAPAHSTAGCPLWPGWTQPELVLWPERASCAPAVCWMLVVHTTYSFLSKKSACSSVGGSRLTD